MTSCCSKILLLVSFEVPDTLNRKIRDAMMFTGDEEKYIIFNSAAVVSYKLNKKQTEFNFEKRRAIYTYIYNELRFNTYI